MTTTMNGTETLRCEDLKAAGINAETHYLLDVRTPAEFKSAHIPGSVNVPLSDLEGHVDRISGEAAGRNLVIVCASGNRAKKAHELLAGRNIPGTVLEGGANAWDKAGYDMNKQASGAISLERQVRIVAGSLVFVGAALGAFVHPGFIGISAFVGAGLVFAGVTDTCGMAMMLAKMPWNRA